MVLFLHKIVESYSWVRPWHGLFVYSKKCHNKFCIHHPARHNHYYQTLAIHYWVATWPCANFPLQQVARDRPREWDVARDPKPFHSQTLVHSHFALLYCVKQYVCYPSNTSVSQHCHIAHARTHEIYLSPIVQYFYIHPWSIAV